MSLVKSGVRRQPSTLGQFIVGKVKKCKVCRNPISSDARPGAVVCGAGCAASLAVSDRLRAEKRAAVKAAKLATADRRDTRAKLQALKTRGQSLKEAKAAIQRFRRLEELALGSGCMSCGRAQQEVAGTDAWKPGGAWDGGHFLSKGARPELALEPLNIWLQCKSCNAGSSKYARKGYTVNASFRLNLVERIGLEAVEALEANHTQKHYTTDELIALKAAYNIKTRALLKAQI